MDGEFVMSYQANVNVKLNMREETIANKFFLFSTWTVKMQ